MASGLEIAGVVLGALPLVIAALEHYATGVQTFKRYWCYKGEFRSLLVRIRSQRTIYLNTIQRLLTGIVRVEHMANLMEDPGGAAWHDQHLNDELEKRLGRAYDDYRDNMEAMKSALKTMMKKLALNAEGKVQCPDVNTFHYEYQRLKFSLKKSAYEEQITRLTTHNATLSTLLKQSLDLEQSRKAVACPNFKALQNYAREFFQILRSGMQCTSGCIDHAVNLRLENRKAKDRHEDLSPFRVVFTRASNEKWKEADVRCLAEEIQPTSPPTYVPMSGARSGSVRHTRFSLPDPNQLQSTTITVTQPRTTLSAVGTAGLTCITDLCQTMHRPQTLAADSCVGYLLDSADRKHGIYPRLQSPASTAQPQWSSYSLAQVLTEPSIIGLHLRQGDKLGIAMYLSSSMLQLYGTPWLNEQWCNKDIYFVHQPGLKMAEISKRPYVYRELSAAAASQAGQMQLAPSLKSSKTLFSLGTVLIELWYGKPIEQLAAERNFQGTHDLAWYTAERLIQTDLPYEAGALYTDVVKRCIRCEFGPVNIDLSEDSFQKIVFDRVVEPLETAFKQFKGLTPEYA
ncbi:hypothetical protein C7974DRAFT_350533 [Boeremia exigua]|uniref:uncharacterized protein n=1 Tax=Boeremia exigua TaxID=749465 RepID=UPI001E8CBCC0|nr:uncharacterized protein C7974DRAFT_350533 [Boeremia exigua]KAH6642192.1 hypothetical protein C7974DRAFT_350533 [Boeremia exigua]